MRMLVVHLRCINTQDCTRQQSGGRKRDVNPLHSEGIQLEPLQRLETYAEELKGRVFFGRLC